MDEYRPHGIITDVLTNNSFLLDGEGKMALPTGAGLGVELNDEFRN